MPTPASADLGYPTLDNVMKTLDPSGAEAAVIEQLTKFNSLLQDAPFIEGNQATGHRVTATTGLPSIGWRRVNEGVANSKAVTDQFDESCGLLAGMSIVDQAVLDLNGNGPAYRAGQDRRFMMAMNNEVETGAFYHSTLTNPEKFLGLTARLNSSTGTYGSQIVKADSAASGSDQHSIWLVGWGPETVYMIYPKSSKGGITMEDLGKLPVTSSGKTFVAWQTYWEWKVGLVVADYRYVVRVCNIDTSNFDPTADIIVPAMIKAYHQLYSTQGANFRWYMDRKTATYLHLQARNFAKYQITFEQVGAEFLMHVLGIPVRITDGLTGTEAVVS